MMNDTDFSTDYTVQKLTSDDIPMVFDLCRKKSAVLRALSAVCDAAVHPGRYGGIAAAENGCGQVLSGLF